MEELNEQMQKLGEAYAKAAQDGVKGAGVFAIWASPIDAERYTTSAAIAGDNGLLTDMVSDVLLADPKLLLLFKKSIDKAGQKALSNALAEVGGDDLDGMEISDDVCDCPACSAERAEAIKNNPNIN